MFTETKGKKGKLIDFQETGFIPGKNPSNNSKNSNKDIVLRISPRAGSLHSFFCSPGLVTASKMNKRDTGGRNGGNGSIVKGIPPNAVVCHDGTSSVTRTA